MATLGVLRKVAKDLGVSASDIRSATSTSELQALIAEQMNGGPKAAPRKSSMATRTRTKVAAKSGTAKPKRGRPAGSASSKSKPAAQSAQGKAKRSASTNGDSGRHMLVDVDYTATDGWKAREGSVPALIVSLLRKFKGNRDKVYDALLPDVFTKGIVGRKLADGSKRTKESAATMLRYRISRTAWDFAMKTGQHEKSENRAEYGTAGTGAGATRTAPKRKTATRKASTTARPQKAAQKPTAAPKRRGRPPGSKNKPKAVTTAATKPVAKKKTARR